MVKKKPAAAAPATKKATGKPGTLIAPKTTVAKPRAKAPMKAAPLRRSKPAAGSASAQKPEARKSNDVMRSAHAPTTVRFFVADDMRQEHNGKVTAVGLYPDDVIVAEMPPSVPDPTPEFMAQLPGVSILASAIVPPGEHQYQFEIDPSSILPPMKESSGSARNIGTTRIGESVNLIMRLAPLPIVGFGMVTVAIHVDGIPFRYSFEIRRKDKAA